MILLEIGNSLDFLIYLIFFLWFTPIVMFIAGLIKLRSSPKTAKVLLIISGIWLLIGLGFCGSLMIM